MSSYIQSPALTRRNPPGKEGVADVQKTASDRALILSKPSLNPTRVAPLVPVGPSGLEQVGEEVLQTHWEFQDDYLPFWLLVEAVGLVAQNVLPLSTLVYLVWTHVEVFGTCICHAQNLTGLEMLCSFTLDHARCLPSFVMMACVNRAGYLMMHMFVYHQFLKYGVLIQYEHTFRSFLGDPIAYVLSYYLLCGLSHLPVQLIFYHMDPVQEGSGVPDFSGKRFVLLFVIPLLGLFGNYLAGYSIMRKLVPLNVFVGIGTGPKQNPAMAAHALLGSTAKVREREFQEADWDFILEPMGNYDEVAVKDVIARIKEIKEVPLIEQRGCRPMLAFLKCLKYLGSSWWTARLIFDDRFRNEDFQRFRKYWALFAMLGVVIDVILFWWSFRRLLRMVGFVEITEDGLDWSRGHTTSDTIISAFIRIVHVLLIAWQLLGLLLSMRVRKKTSWKAGVGIEMSSLPNGTLDKPPSHYR